MSKKGKTGKTSNTKDFLSTGEVAEILKLHRRTVSYLAKMGRLPTAKRWGGEGHYRYPREGIAKLKKNIMISHTVQGTHMELRELAELQRQLGHLENIRQRVRELKTELVFPPPQFLHIIDLSMGERYLPSYPPVRWQQVDDGSYVLTFGNEFDLVMEHLRSSGNRDLLRALERWQQLGGNCVEECHRLQVSTRELARRRTKIEKELDTGQWARGLYEGFWWTIYSGGFSAATDDLEYKKTSEKNDLCILSELGDSTNLACTYTDEFEAVKTVHRKLRREQREFPLVREIVTMTAEMDALKQLLSHELDEFAKQEIIPGKCSACVI